MPKTAESIEVEGRAGEGGIVDDTAESEKPKIRTEIVKKAGEQYYRGYFPDEKLTDEELEHVIHYVPPGEVATVSQRLLRIPSRIAKFVQDKIHTPTASDYNPIDTGEPPSRKVA